VKTKIFLGALFVFVVIQFIRPSKNLGASAGAPANDITVLHPTPAVVKDALERACYDCHSDRTRYPWYAEIQPVGWWLANHVSDGKRHLNFSQFGTYEPKRATRKMKQTIEQLRDGEMPLTSYTWIHRDARLSDEERTALESWAQTVQERVTVSPTASVAPSAK
jgi:hypothetical protein